MPEPVATRRATPPGSVLVVRVDPAEAEDTFPFMEELHRQTGLPVVVVTPGAELTVTTPADAVAVLARALETADGPRVRPAELATEILIDLRVDGWELVRLREP